VAIISIASLFERAGADVTQVVKGMWMDPRIGREFLQPGLCYGGSCFPKDTDSLIQTAASRGYEFRLLRSVVEVNRERAQRFVALVRQGLHPPGDRGIAGVGLGL